MAVVDPDDFLNGSPGVFPHRTSQRVMLMNAWGVGFDMRVLDC